MPFKLWPCQVPLLWALMTERLIVILKARQLGISWICCWYALWLCLFQPGKLVLLFSKGQAEANELLRRILALYDRLPEWLRDAAPPLIKRNTTEAAWANDSRILSLPASQHAGSSYTASLVILDEAAKLLFADALFAALKPTIDAGGQLIMLGTANGIGNLFHRVWTRAVSGLNTFKTIFLPWQSRPGRDQIWYAAQLAEYPDPAIVKQEYPSTANEAFLVSGRVRFPTEWIARQAENVRPGLSRDAWPKELRHLTGLTLYAPPVSGRRSVIGADVAEGLEHGDYSAAVLIDAETWEEIAHLHGHWEPDEFANALLDLASLYSATVGVERNNHGHAVLSKARSLIAERRTTNVRLAYGHDSRPGWLTTAQTKPLIIDGLAIALRDGLAKVRSQASLDEMQIYRVGPNGSTSAPSGYYDDRVMSWAIALVIAARERPAQAGENPLY
jgi:hypothetical protein